MDHKPSVCVANRLMFDACFEFARLLSPGEPSPDLVELTFKSAHLGLLVVMAQELNVDPVELGKTLLARSEMELKGDI